jgi:hypothetical protein
MIDLLPKNWNQKPQNQDINHVLVNHGIKLLKQVESNKAKFTSLFFNLPSNHWLIHSLLFEHYATLLTTQNIQLVLTILKMNYFQVTKQFPSQILAKKLKHKYIKSNQPSPKISIIKANNKNKSQLELFICTSGLNQKQIIESIPLETHLAFRLKKNSQFNQIFDYLNGQGFVFQSKGINKIEQMTALYFVKDQQKIELFLPGIHLNLIKKIT